MGVGVKLIICDYTRNFLFLINKSVTVRLVFLFEPGAVMSVSISRTSLLNFLSHREECGLQCIICLALHAANLRYTTLFHRSVS